MKRIKFNSLLLTAYNLRAGIGGLSCKCHENLQVRITAVEANPWQADNRRALSTPVNGASIDVSKLCIDNFET